jgi:hypothetical protein
MFIVTVMYGEKVTNAPFDGVSVGKRSLGKR